MRDFEIKSSVNEDYANIENDINDISTIIANVYKAMLTLDDRKWKSKEKEKIDQEFVVYLKNISEKIPSNLTKRLNYAKLALEKHQEQDIANAKIVENEVATPIVEEL